MRYRVPLNTSNWARYIDKEIIIKPFLLCKSCGVLAQQINSFNSEIYYKKKNYLKVKTAVFKYITPPIVKGSVYWYVGTSVYYTPTFPYSHILNFTIWLSYPLSYSSTNFISPTSCTLILTQYKSPFSTCTILFIRSVIYNR